MRRAAWLLLLALAGCAGPGQQAEPAEEDFLAGREAGADSDATTAPDPHIGEGELATYWDAVVHRQLSTAGGRRYRLKVFHKTEHFSIAVLGVAATMPPPPASSKKTELLFVVEADKAIVTMSGRRYRVSAGSVAVFPPGTRGEIVAREGDPLLGLLVSIDAPCPPGTRPYLSSFERLWGDESFATNQNTDSKLLEIPGVLSLHGQTIYSFIPPHYHPSSETLTFFIQGQGSYGLGGTGNLVKDGSLLVAPVGVPHYFQNNSPNGSRALVLHTPELKSVAGEPYMEAKPEPEAARLRSTGDTVFLEGHPEGGHRIDEPSLLPAAPAPAPSPSAAPSPAPGDR